MWTLAPGLVASTQKGWGELRSLATGERWDLRPEDLPIIRALAAGIDDARATEHRELSAAANRGWAVQAKTTRDEHVRRRLDALERHFAWCRSAYTASAHEAVVEGHAARRHTHRGFAQYSALPETVARRAALLGAEPRRVLLLGDDDLLTLALLAHGHSVTVLEIDNAIVDFLRGVAPPHTPCEVLVHDLREPLRAPHLGGFDAFFADPPSGPGGLRLFLARGIAALKADGQGFVSVSEAGAASFDELVRDLHIDVADQFTDFNHYYAPDYTLAFHTRDLAVVRPRPDTALRPRPDEPYLPRGLSLEDGFLATPASRYAFKNINPETSQIIHLDTMIRVLERTGRLKVVERSYFEDGGVRSYLMHTQQGGAVLVRLLPDAQAGELFVAPADSALEDALVVVLLGVIGIAGTVVEKRRVRGSNVYTMV